MNYTRQEKNMAGRTRTRKDEAPEKILHAIRSMLKATLKYTDAGLKSIAISGRKKKYSPKLYPSRNCSPRKQKRCNDK